MECDRCGARRPRTGPCPQCGAPAPGTFSSLRQWRDQPRTGQDPASGRGASGRGGSGAGWGAGSSGSGMRQRGSGAGWRGGDDWGDDAYDEPPMSRSARRRRIEPEYDEVELGQALVPVQNDMLPMDASGLAPGLPGMPATEEEERALGIRRPVYIPAVEGKRKRKLGTWRVVSGVLSVMLVCAASCGLAGLLGKNQIAAWTHGLVGTRITPVTFSTANVPVTPVATAGPASTHVKNVVTATAVANDGRAINPTSHFLTQKPVYLVGLVTGIPKGEQHTVSVRWFLQGVYLPVDATNSAVTVTKDSRVRFSLNIPTPGLGMAKIYYDRPANDVGDSPTDPSLAQTIYFAVEAPTPTANPNTTPTKPASPTGSPSGSPTASPKALSGEPPVAWLAKPPGS